MLSILSEPNRQKILQLVWKEEQSAGAIAEQFEITFGAVSQHLRVLREHGLVDLRKEGRTHFYKANHQTLGPLAPFLESLWASRLQTLKSLAETEERFQKPKN